jgi:putative ABC transport system ATP-binding protein
VLGFLRANVDDHGQTIVMVTHDPIAAAYTDRVIFLADGLVVDELRGPTAERILEKMRILSTPVRPGAHAAPTPGA